MLNIILLVLKIIGIVLLVVLGIILALVLFLLFIPLTYQVRGSYHNKLETLEISGRACWLLAMTKAIAEYKHPDLSWRAYFLWFHVSSEDEEEPVVEKKTKHKTTDKRKTKQKTTEVVKESSMKQRVDTQDKHEEVVESAENDVAQVQCEECAGLPPENSAHTVKQKGTYNKNVNEKDETRSRSTKKGEKKSGTSKKKSKSKRNKTRHKMNISQTIRKICDNIKVVSEKKEEVVQFFQNPVNQHTIGKVKRECLYLWRKTKPHVLKINGDVGFEDPATTGKMLGVLGALYPIYGNAIQVTPYFDEVIYEGTFVVKGRTMLFPFVKTVVVLVLDKKVMKTYKTIKEFQF